MLMKICSIYLLGKFIESPYNGFILKPLRHDFSDFLKWLHYAPKSNIPCLIGSVVCDHVRISPMRVFLINLQQYKLLSIQRIASFIQN